MTTITAIPVREEATVTITPSDSDGDPENGHQIQFTDDLTVTISVVSKDESRSRDYIVRFGELPPPAECIRGLSEARISTVSNIGGSIDQLAACAQERGIAALFHWDGRTWLLVAPDGPEFVNRQFLAHFNEGLPVDTEFFASRSPN